MSEVSDRYSTIADGFTAHLVGVPPDRWSTPSPCTDWVAADVVAHVINTHRRVLSTLDGSEPASVASGDDLPGAWSAATADLLDALNDEVRACRRRRRADAVLELLRPRCLTPCAPARPLTPPAWSTGLPARDRPS